MHHQEQLMKGVPKKIGDTKFFVKANESYLLISTFLVKRPALKLQFY